MKKLSLVCVAILICNVSANSQVLPLIPYPQEVSVKNGTFTANKVKAHEIIKTIELFLPSMEILTGLDININQETDKQFINLKITNSNEIGKEGYRLLINEKGIHVEANSSHGLFYGIQTIKQLIPADNNEKVDFPFIEITDNPRFAWRGMHLDVGRHFMPVDFIKKYIDYLAMLKMNTFHWHLTEDQGWRIEIKKYPKLTKVGGWRNETVVGHNNDKPRKYDGTRHGGFYTQEEIKEVVDYAYKKFITIVPEIEMPGHSKAAIAAYPELGCVDGKVKVKQEWGISPYIYNVEESTFKFLEDVISEVVELFPGEYIHIGGDEALKDQWKSSEKVQRRIKELGITNEEELQSYFISRMEKFINSKGKKIIGWDEILEGGLAPNAAVMSWRGTKGGIEATHQKHYVVMSPTTHCYFDYYQSDDREKEPLAIGGYLPLEKVYSLEPVPDELEEENKKYILGAQGNVWTEYIKTPEQVEYMVFPRILALAEVVWLQPETKDYENFKKRLNLYRPHLDKMGINYSKHGVE